MAIAADNSWKKLLATLANNYCPQNMQALLNKKEKKQLVIQLYQEGRTIRDIASAAHLSFGDIGKIVKSLDGNAKDGGIDLSNKSKATQALYLFEQGKRPVDVAIELDMPYGEIEELQQEYWALTELYDLAFAYMEIKNYLPSFMKLFQILKQNKMLGEQHISKLLRYAVDIPSLELKIQRLRSEIIDLEFKKKDLTDTLKIQNAQLLDLGQTIMNYQNVIDNSS